MARTSNKHRGSQSYRKRKRREAAAKAVEGSPSKKLKSGPMDAEEGDGDGERGLRVENTVERDRSGKQSNLNTSEQIEDSNTTTTTTNTTTISWPPTLPDSPLITQLSKSHALTQISIASHHSIQKKTTQVLKLLETYPTPEGEKPALVVLKSKGKTACKLITVVEICKREITAMEGKGKWFQYSVVEGVMEMKPAGATKGPAKDDSERMEEEEAEADKDKDGFETMKTPFERAIEGKPKVRQMPYMTVYLSRNRIEVLRKAFGEQTNGLEATT